MLNKKKKASKKVAKQKSKAKEKLDLAIAKIEELSLEADDFFHSTEENSKEEQNGRD